MRVIVILVACASYGCSTASAFRFVHAIDTVQTIRGPALTDGCYETDPITAALIGHKPSVAEVALWSVGVVVAYEWARRQLSGGWQTWFDRAALAAKAWVVMDNTANGIPVFGAVDCR